MNLTLPSPRLLPAALCALALAGCKRSTPSAAHGHTPVPPALQATKAAVVPPSASLTASAAPDKAPEPQPPAQPCLPDVQGRDPGLPELLDQAARNYEKGQYDQALECSREATRLDESSVAAHHFRGAALIELGKLDEARTAYARALALDPDDPEVLRSAADLHVRRLGSRDDLELALVYVKRALPRALKGRDRALLAELHLLRAMALDDLGRSRESFAASSRALDYDPKDREARRERGVALFEMSRFSEARRDFERLTADAPDAWAEHYLGLIAERSQDDVAAAAHFSKAHQLDPESFKQTESPASDFFDQVVREEVAKLPSDIRAGLARSDFSVQDLPDLTDLTATNPPLSPNILGLFRPPAETASADAKPAILLYRRNLARTAHSVDELHREVRDTLLHEVGHLNGEDDEQLRDRGL